MDKEHLLKQIQQLFQQQNWQAMEQLCTQGLKYFPHSASTYYNRAIARANLQNLKEAKQDLEKALELRPTLKEALFLLEKLTSNKIGPSLLLQQEDSHLKELFQQQPKPVAKIGRYQIVQEIGRGGMGCVYKAYDPQIDRSVALKTMLSGIREKELQRFALEAKTMAKFSHANIVKIYDVGKDNGAPFIAMDFIEGQSLEQYLQNTSINVRKFSQLILKIAKAIQYSHERDIIHRDLKPANIMLDQNLEPYITDFGMAKVVSSKNNLSKKGAIIGTPRYMSPQQAQGQKLNHLSDVYALGAIFYRMLAGKPMVEGKSIAEILFKVINKEPVLLGKINNKVAKDLEIICSKAVAKDVSKRYQSAREFAEDIERFLHGEIIKARSANFVERCWHYMRKNKSSIAICLFCFLLLFFGQSLLVIYQSKKKEKQANKYYNKALKTIQKAKMFVLNQRRQIKLYDSASNDLEKALALAPNLTKTRTRYFKLQEKIGNLAKKQKNNLLAYAIFKQCQKRGFTRANRLLEALEQDQQNLKQKHIALVENIMNKIATKIQQVTIKNLETNFQQNQIIDWYMFKIIQINKPYVLERLIAYFKNGNKWQRILAIRAIGRLKNRYTKFAEKDSVEWLLDALGKFKDQKTLQSNEQEVEEIIWALGWLQDQRANSLVYKKRWLAGENSLLWTRTKIPYKKIPIEKRSAKNTNDFITRGLMEQEKGNYKKAIADFNKAIALNPGSSRAYNKRGTAYKDQKKYHNAIADYSKAIALNPKFSLAYNNRGSIYNYLKKYHKAIVNFNKAIELNPTSSLTYHNRGNTYCDLKEYQQALADFNKAIKLNPKSSLTYNSRGNIYNYLKKYHNAIVDYSKAISLNPKFSLAYNNRGNIYDYLKKYHKAMADYSKAIFLNPTSSLTYNNRGNTYCNLNELPKAIVDYSKAIFLNPTYSKAYYNRGNAYFYLKQYQKAIVDYSKAIALNPNSEAYNNRGSAYKDLKQYSNAVADFDKAIALNSKFLNAYINKGNLYLYLKQYQKAYRNFQMFLKLAPYHPATPQILKTIKDLRKNNLIR